MTTRKKIYISLSFALLSSWGTWCLLQGEMRSTFDWLTFWVGIGNATFQSCCVIWWLSVWLSDALVERALARHDN